VEAREKGLAAYGELAGVDLSDRPRIVALNKIDVLDAREVAGMVTPMLLERNYQVLEVSAASREGLRELSYALAEQVVADRKSAAEGEPTRVVLRPKLIDHTPFEVVPLGNNTFRVRGDKLTRWVLQT